MKLASQTIATLEPYEHPFQHLETELHSHETAELPAWLEPVRVQTLRWRSGTTLSPRAWECFVGELTREHFDYESTIVRTVRPHLNDLDCYKLCRRMLQAAEHTDAVWTTYILGVVGSPHQVEVLGRDLDSYEHEDSTSSYARDAVETLRRNGSVSSVQWLDHWSKKASNADVRTLCHDALSTIADRRTTTVDDIVEDSLPSLGFDRGGHQSVSYGSRDIHLQLLPDLSLQFRSTNGKIFKNVPRARRSDDVKLASKGRQQIKEIRRDLREFLASHAERLEEAMCSGRSWPVRVWRKRFIEHPILSRNAPLYVFLCETKTSRTYFSVSRDGDFPVNLQGERLLLPAQSLVRLVHPVDMNDEERNAWIAFQSMRELPTTRPFRQLRRPFVRRSEQTTAWDQLITGISPTAKDITRRARKRNMLHHSERNNPLHRLTKSYGAYNLTLTYRREPAPGFDEDPIARVIELSVKQKSPDGLTAQGPDEVPESAYSEIARDIQFLASGKKKA